ncbi:YcxB family protein [Litoribacter alkaliphilus]|uniref:YcxB family protein n=1 Tax=Litoribacter ruber TaxID=702568 RepID=A0AAP2CHP2_9BACT|nr:YcxB family protein [Litoribacter alkaliphilus]MBS9524005.1 YcxB family protein [Litoribacter alkaliphilus]
MSEVTIHTGLSFKDYRRANFFLLYRRNMTRGMLVLGVLLILGTVVLYFLRPDYYSSFPILPIALGAAMVLLPPLSLLRSSKKNYFGDARLREKFTYKLDRERIQVLGESFDTTFSWKKLYKFEVSDHWVLLWQNAQMALLIPKRDVTEGQIQRLKDIAGKHPGVRTKY